MLVTDLPNAEAVFGKLAERFVPMLGLVECAAPVAALASLFGGIDPQTSVSMCLRNSKDLLAANILALLSE